MAHFVKLNVFDPSHDDSDNKHNRKYITTLINLDLVMYIEPSKVHSLIFTKNSSAQPIRVKESLDDILRLSKGESKVLNG